MTDDLPQKLHELSKEEAEAYIAKQGAEWLKDFVSGRPGETEGLAKAFWDIRKHIGLSDDMRELIQGALDRGVRFFHPYAQNEEEELRGVDEIWATTCDTNGRMLAKELPPSQHIVVKIDCGTGVLLDGEEP